MATNQQLKDYIAQQTKLGVSKDTIKSSLLGAGWNEGDVTQAMAEAESGAQTVAPLTPAQPFSKPAEPAAKPAPVSFVASDIFQAKNEPVFQSAGIGKMGSSNFPEAKPQIVSASPSAKEKPAGMGGKILPITLGVLSAALLGGNIYFFLQNGDLNSKLVTLSASNSNKVDPTQLQAQIASLTNDKKTLTDQVSSLGATITDLDNQVSIFALAPTSSIVSVPFEVSGTLGGGGKLLYSLTTSKNIVLSVKNSKEANVDASLKSLIGTQVKLGGTHQPGSISLTVVTVNDRPVNATSTTPAAQSSSAASSSAQSSAKATTTVSSSGTGTAASATTTVSSQATSTSNAPAIGASTSSATSTP